MKHPLSELQGKLFVLLVLSLVTCKGKVAVPSKETIAQIHLKRGELISCGLEGTHFGLVDFETSCSGKEKKQFNLAMELLHSFEYDEAEKVFSTVIDETPECAMAYWGVAMCNFHPLWTAPSGAELTKGAKAIEIAQGILKKSRRETAYIDAIAAIFTDWDKVDWHTRCVKFEAAMEVIYRQYPNDKEAAIWYALSLDAAADPSDKTFSNQKKAGVILTSLYPNQPEHPRIGHYIIHTYDYPGLAALALPAARKYAAVAPSSAHARHMPSHIFTRLGLWDECIQSNISSIASAQCYAEAAEFIGHWDEELHSMDYLVYAYLQKGQNELAREQCDYLSTIEDVFPINFKDAYAFAAIPARYVLENQLWQQAATLPLYPSDFPWEKFPWQKAINSFTHALGHIHIDRLDSAYANLNELDSLHALLIQQKDDYKANQVLIQVRTIQAWIALKEGKNADALKWMTEAADREDNTEKHPVTPGEVLPARELLGDLLLLLNQPRQALAAYEADLKTHPNRLNGLYGAGLAAERAGDPVKAAFYYPDKLHRPRPTTF